MKKISIILLLAMLVMCCTACSNLAKREKEIAKDISKKDSMFKKFSLDIKEYEVTKRQTNKEEKTDYVWITLEGANKEFEYIVDYKLVYVLYNDGWKLENYELLDSSYKALKSFDPSKEEKKLSKEYDNLTLVDTTKKKNKTTLIYTAEENSEFLTTLVEIKVSAEFTPSSWKVVSTDKTEVEKRLNIIGEWMYTDKDGRYYYMHISKVDGKVATMDYIFLNTNRSDEWNYISSDGYIDVKLKTYYSSVSGENENLLYFHLKNKESLPGGAGGDIDFGYLWIEETLMTDGETFNGFTINEKYLERKNKSKKPVIGKDSIPKMDVSYNEELEIKDNMSDEEKIVTYLKMGKHKKALECIGKIGTAESKIKKIRKEILSFQKTYGDLLGTWQSERDDEQEFKIRCGYDKKVILVLEMGENIEGEKKLYSLYETKDNTLIFNSDRFEPDKYHNITYYSGDSLHYCWEVPSENLDTFGTEYIRK